MTLRRSVVFLGVSLAAVAGFVIALVVTGPGGAALAAAFMGAVGVYAAPSHQNSPSASEKTGKPLPVTGRKTDEKKAVHKKETQKKTDARIYTVKAGDFLSRIADEQNVGGGWRKLYADNREAIGAHPSLIRPGLKLIIGGKNAEATASKPSSSAFKAPSKDLSGSNAPTTKEAATTDSKPSTSTPSVPSSASKPPSTDSPGAGDASTPQNPEDPAPPVEDPGTVAEFVAPAPGIPLGTGYKEAGVSWSSGYHTGVDFLAPSGTALQAVGAGTVVSAGWDGSYGNEVIIELADGCYAQYAHLSFISVSSGETVTAGQQIGLSGATGNVTGPHLHFEIRTTPYYGSDIDPVAYLRSKGVVIG
ncbi:peptidoglycan DD-metalloendopeptidase family protein [Streptomyces sp. NPDC056663]|uniref:M23 family metallopeptidase n=1 Tax=Streptomyces sp. NPDC056663 TaxID=3345899 RepID=UPI00368407FA